MQELFIPTLHTFAMKNTFTGSMGMFRFRVKPNVVMATPKEVDFEQSTLFAEYWHGLLHRILGGAVDTWINKDAQKCFGDISLQFP